MAMRLWASRSGAGALLSKLSGTWAVALVLMLASCQSPESQTQAPLVNGDSATASAPTTDSEAEPYEASQTSQVIGDSIVSDPALIPGRHCYSINSETLTGAVGLTVKADDSVVGESQATVHNEAVGYYTSYGQTFTGAIADDQLTLEVTSYIEDDVQQSQETWSLGNDQLTVGQDVFEQVDCSVAQEQLGFVDEIVAQTAIAAQLESATASPNPLTEAASNVRVRRLSFAPGASSAFVDDAVVRAERDQYLLGAGAGQTMTVSIMALEQNAVFGIVAPDGSVLLNEDTFAELELSQAGDYSIVVGGTRGNASYSLEVAIR